MNSNSRFYFVLLSVCAAIGIGNIWVYPYFSFRYTGLFFIPYLTALLILGVPLLVLEFSVGQYFDKSIVDAFASIRKWFSSIGWLMIFNAFIVMSFYAVIFSWHIIYFLVSFGFQWKNYAKPYFFNNVLQVSNGFKNFSQFSLPVFIALIIAWVIIFFYIRKGAESLKKAFLMTFPVLIILMFFFLFYSLTLDGALNGVYSFLKPRFKGLLDIGVWVKSFSLAVLSLGVSFGIMHGISRKNGDGFLFENSLIIAIFKVLISIIIGFIVFGILGFLSLRQGTGLNEIAFSDSPSAFTTLAKALPFFYKPTLLSMSFFIFLSIFFIFGTASLAFSVSDVLAHKFKTKLRNAAIIVSGFGFLFGLLFVIKPGFYIMDIVSHFIYYNILIALLLEAAAIAWFFESEKISERINRNSLLKIGNLWRFIVKYIAPLILMLLLFIQLKTDFYSSYKNYPWWAVLIFGVGTVLIPSIIAFLMPQKILDRR